MLYVLVLKFIHYTPIQYTHAIDRLPNSQWGEKEIEGLDELKGSGGYTLRMKSDAVDVRVCVDRHSVIALMLVSSVL